MKEAGRREEKKRRRRRADYAVWGSCFGNGPREEQQQKGQQAPPASLLLQVFYQLTFIPFTSLFLHNPFP